MAIRSNCKKCGNELINVGMLYEEFTLLDLYERDEVIKKILDCLPINSGNESST